MANTIQRSRYWRFKVIEKDAVDGWEHMVLNYPTIISPKHTRDAKPEFLKNHTGNERLHKADKLDAFYYVFYLNKNAIDITSVKNLANRVNGTNITLIPDQSSYDWDLKLALRNSEKSNYSTNYLISQFQTGKDIIWKNENTHTGYYYYLRPYSFSQNQLLKYRYWTKKCLEYLPSHADGQKRSSYGSGYYDVYSEDTIDKIENEEPVASIIAKKKKRLTDKNEIEKAKKTQEKRQQTIKRHKQEKLEKAKKKFKKESQDIIAKFKDELAKQKLADGSLYELGKVMKYMAILNHIAKTLQDIEHSYAYDDSKIFEDNNINEILFNKYQSSNYLYQVKDQLINCLIAENFMYGQSTKPYINLKAVIPYNADKVYVYYCEEHNEMRQIFEEMPQDFYFENKNMIDSCSNCHVSLEPNYYAFYYLSVNLPSGLTDFHIPYPIGQSFMPKLTDLPKIKQSFNANGGYLFGREADKNEILLAANLDLLTPVLQYAHSHSMSDYTPEQRKKILTVVRPGLIQPVIDQGKHLLTLAKFLNKNDQKEIQKFIDLDLINCYTNKQYQFVLEKLNQFKLINKTITNKLALNSGYCLFKYIKKHPIIISLLPELQGQYQDLIHQSSDLLDNWINSIDNLKQAQELQNKVSNLYNEIYNKNNMYSTFESNSKQKLPQWSNYMPADIRNNWKESQNALKELLKQNQTLDTFNQAYKLHQKIKSYKAQNKKYSKIQREHKKLTKKLRNCRKTINQNAKELTNIYNQSHILDFDYSQIEKVLNQIKDPNQLNVSQTQEGLDQLNQLKKQSHQLIMVYKAKCTPKQ